MQSQPVIQEKHWEWSHQNQLSQGLSFQARDKQVPELPSNLGHSTILWADGLQIELGGQGEMVTDSQACCCTQDWQPAALDANS